MITIPADRNYSDLHLWFRKSGPDEGLLGLTDILQARLGDIIAADLPRGEMEFPLHETVAVLEGLCETFEMPAFCNMKILAVNPRLEIHPDLINRSPYGDGWILKVRLTGVPRWLDAPQYADYLQKGLITEGA